MRATSKLDKKKHKHSQKGETKPSERERQLREQNGECTENDWECSYYKNYKNETKKSYYVATNAVKTNHQAPKLN